MELRKSDNGAGARVLVGGTDPLTPGLIMAAKNLLDKNPDPTEEETRYYLAGNLCRCTGYDKISRAVLDAADEMRGKAP